MVHKKQKAPALITSNKIHTCISKRMEIKLDSLGSGSLIWALSEEQIEYIKNHYNYSVQPIIYKIKTCKHFEAKKNQPSIIKEIIYCAYHNKPFLYKNIKLKEKAILDSYEIWYRPIKYLITTKPYIS